MRSVVSPSFFKTFACLYVAAALFTACGGGSDKKVLVMASGKVQASGNTITLEPGTTHNEITFVPDGDSITVNAPSGSTGYSLKDPGYYLINLKKDTIVGAYQPLGSETKSVITKENLRFRIDSLYQLMQGYNVSEAARNFHLPPFAMARVTTNTNAQIIGPYLKMPTSFDPSKEHEVYKFSTNKEAMETIMKLIKLAR